MLAKLADAGLPVLLAGMLAPPNLGRDYGEAFNAIYPRLAEQHDVPLYPFFLEGVAAQRALNQADGIHPNATGVAERSEEHTSELQSLMRISNAVFCLKTQIQTIHSQIQHNIQKEQPS